MKKRFPVFIGKLATILLLMQSVSANAADIPDQLQFGIPREPDMLVSRRGFSLGYSKKYRQALWVSYILTADNLRSPKVRRSNKFQIDPEIKDFPVTPAEYTRTGYDRGHLAPAADMTYSLPTMNHSFFMSNISPQIPGCNRGIWKRLEEQVRRWAIREGEIYVITGPVFQTNSRTLPSSLPVPDAFYKVILDMTPPYKMAAFIIPNFTTKKRFLSFAVSVDEVERVTGLDFFGALPDDLENGLEKRIDIKSWQIKR